MSMGAEQAWGAVASGEDAAIYAYSAAGARVRPAERDSARRAREEHVRLRDQAASRAGAEIPPAPAYDVGGSGLEPVAARAVLAQAELALVALYAQAAAASSGAHRRSAARTGTQCAMRATSWGAPSEAFPD